MAPPGLWMLAASDRVRRLEMALESFARLGHHCHGMMIHCLVTATGSGTMIPTRFDWESGISEPEGLADGVGSARVQIRVRELVRCPQV